MKNDRDWLLEEKYNGIETDAFLHDLTRLESGEPLAYVIGWTPFWGTKIYLDSHPLIPRTETEYWVEKESRDLKDTELTILDLCSGSGAIGIGLLSHLPKIHVDFAEIVEKHHATIEKNIKENGIDATRSHIFGGDLFENATGQYDYIFSNPPYISKTQTDRVEESVIKNEPHEALFADDEGFEIINRIINEAPKYLRENGILLIEHEPEHTDLIKHLCPNAVTNRDQFGIERWSKITF